ncbi:MAG: hypothetical protein IJT34_05450 [Butyrivibrio sp.]|nr:hypothetical protein [Butyrivibrio sp.]
MTNSDTPQSANLMAVSRLLLSFVATALFPMTFGLDTLSVNNSILVLAVWLGINGIMQWGALPWDRRLYSISWVLGLMYALMQVCGARLLAHETLIGSGWMWLAVPVYTLVFGAFIRALYHGLEKKAVWQLTSVTEGIGSASEKTGCRGLLQTWGVILLCWIPVWLAAYPGFFCYDQDGIYASWLAHSYPAKHAPILQMMEGAFIAASFRLTGTANPGIALYVFLQMTVISGVLAWSVQLALPGAEKRLLRMILTAYYALLPVISIFSICTTKDVPFAMLTVTVVLMLWQLLRDPQRFLSDRMKLILFFFCSTLMLLCRRNAIYALIVSAAVLIPVCHKGYRLKFTALLISVICCNLLVVSVIYPRLGVRKSSDVDAYSIPIQQLTRAWLERPDAFDPSDRELLSELTGEELRKLQNYVPVVANPVKMVYQDALSARRADFLRLWARIGWRVPMVYLDAMLMQSLYGWYPPSIIDGKIRVENEKYSTSETSWFLCTVEEPGELQSKLPWLYDRLWTISRMISFQRIPVISLFFSVGWMFWLLLFTMGYLLYRRSPFRLASLMFPLMLCGTYFLGPIVQVRYYLPLFYLMAYMVSCLFEREAITTCHMDPAVVK